MSKRESSPFQFTLETLLHFTEFLFLLAALSFHFLIFKLANFLAIEFIHFILEAIDVTNINWLGTEVKYVLVRPFLSVEFSFITW